MKATVAKCSLVLFGSLLLGAHADAAQITTPKVATPHVATPHVQTPAYKGIMNGTHIKSGMISARKGAGDGAGRGNRKTRLNFTKVQLTYKPQSSDGSEGAHSTNSK
jgi:hypothetical protein